MPVLGRPGLTPWIQSGVLAQREGCTPPESWLCSVPFFVPNLSPRQVFMSAFAICPSLQDFCGHRSLWNEAIVDTHTGFCQDDPVTQETDKPAGHVG